MLNQNQNASLEHNEDSIDYVVHFRPPLTRDDARRASVSVTYCGEKRQTSRASHLFAAPVLRNGGTPHSLKEGYLDYELFETHVLRVYGGGATIGSLYVTFENNLVTPDHDMDVCVELKVDMALHALPRFVSGVFLRWFPPDVDPAEYGIVIDPRCIPQRTSLWFKLRGIISGTKAYTLLGFWVPNKGTKAAEHYNFFKGDGTFSNFSRAAMRLGSLSEDYCLMAYMSHFRHTTFYECGWCPAPREHYPQGWGASPDGLFIDETMAWEQLPSHIAAQYNESDAFDITRGACEFKTSRTKTSMEAYFIPQVYLEMISLETVWADLLRFRHCRTFDEETHEWHYKDTAYVYRIYRDRALEAEFVEMWKHAYQHAETLVDVVASTRYAKMRQRLEKMAKAMQPVAVIHVEGALAKLFDQYTDYRDHFVYANEPPDQQDTLLWSDLNERHNKLQRLDESRDKREIVALIAAQIEAYASLMKNVI